MMISISSSNEQNLFSIFLGNVKEAIRRIKRGQDQKELIALSCTFRPEGNIYIYLLIFLVNFPVSQCCYEGSPQEQHPTAQGDSVRSLSPRSLSKKQLSQVLQAD